jgi:hypothetical protein
MAVRNQWHPWLISAKRRLLEELTSAKKHKLQASTTARNWWSAKYKIARTTFPLQTLIYLAVVAHAPSVAPGQSPLGTKTAIAAPGHVAKH